MSRFETMEDMQSRAHKTAVAKGWWDAQCEPGGLNREAVVATIPEKLCLIHSEVSEALEDFRVSRLTTTRRESDGKPEGLPTELADIIIRVMDLAGALDINLEREVWAKMDFNDTRSHRHGGKVA